MFGNESSYERFCCAALRFRDVEVHTKADVIRITRMCFADMNITHDRQFEIVLSYALEMHPFNERDCEPQVDACAEHTDPWYFGYICLWIVMLVVGSVSNLTVIIAVHTIPTVRDIIGNYLLSSLAFSDLLGCLCIIPVKMIYSYNNLNFCSLSLCRFYVTSETALFSTSITNLFVISIDRLFALTSPYRYRSWMTLYKMKVIITVTWMYGFTWGILSNIQWNNIYESPILIQNNQCSVDDNPVFLASVYGFVFYIPVVAMAFIYFRIFSVAREHCAIVERNKVTCDINCPPSEFEKEAFVIDIICYDDNNVEQQQDENNSSVQTSDNGGNTSRSSTETPPVVMTAGDNMAEVTENVKNNSKRRLSPKIVTIIKQTKMIIKASKTIVVVYGTFCVCWIPVSVYALKVTFSHHTTEPEDAEQYAEALKWFHIVFVDVLPVFNSMINPFIYAYMNRQYRLAFKLIFAKFKRSFRCGYNE